ncbi:thymidylate synthase [Cribrihabitans neustonicus]|uniref:thymidylate synthase n=1 Tax=Cribrihabitans neustonicus TaxID=1429085 RepID=UPI003B58BC0C
MRRFWLGLAAAGALSACGNGNPFLEDTGDTSEPGDTASIVPAEVAGDVDRISYNSATQTLVISGVGLDETPFSSSYVRKPALDRGGYEAYTVQDSSLDRHSTAYVREIEGGYAVAVATGGQFGYFMAGTDFGRSGNYSAPTADQPSGGIVSYAGSYVGLLDEPGDGGDLLPVAPGTPDEVRPVQAAEITGDAFINADFSDNRVNGTIYNRQITDYPGTTVETLLLAPTDITGEGTFSGEVATQDDGEPGSVGTYAGIFAGENAASVAGSLYAKDHIEAAGSGIEEYGVFVLGQCGGANSDPVCDQPVP